MVLTLLLGAAHDKCPWLFKVWWLCFLLESVRFQSVRFLRADAVKCMPGPALHMFTPKSIDHGSVCLADSACMRPRVLTLVCADSGPPATCHTQTLRPGLQSPSR